MRQRSRREIAACLPRILLVAGGFTLIVGLFFYDFEQSGRWGRLQEMFLLIFFLSSVVLGLETASGLLSAENFYGHHRETGIEWGRFCSEMKRGLAQGHALLQSLILVGPALAAAFIAYFIHRWTDIPQEMLIESQARDVIFFAAYLLAYLWLHFSSSRLWR